MKILQVIPALVNGGAEHFVIELSNELCRQGHSVEVLTLYDVLSDNEILNAFDSRIRMISLHKKKGLDLHMFFKLWKFISKSKFDAVHGHVGAIKYLIIASFLCRKVRFVATIHSEAKREAGKSIDKWSRKLMFCFRSCTPVTISEESELSFEKYYGRKGILIINGVSSYKKNKQLCLRDNDSQIVFLHPASCQPVKNQALLFNAFNRLLDNGVDVKIFWVGSNKAYIDLFESLKPIMSKQIVYLGEVNNVRDYMIASDATCLSSKMEGMPMTIIESFSVGRPVICTPVGGCVNIIKPGMNGLMSDSLSVDSYYKVLKTFVSLPKTEKKKMSEYSRKSFNDYTIEKCAKQYLEVYES